MRTGDLLVFATDGFFDNVWKQEAVDVVKEMQDSTAAEIAERLVQLAYKAGRTSLL